MAQRHFTRADPQLATGENIAMLQAWMSDLAPAELDLLVARTVLQVRSMIEGGRALRFATERMPAVILIGSMRM